MVSVEDETYATLSRLLNRRLEGVYKLLDNARGDWEDRDFDSAFDRFDTAASELGGLAHWLDERLEQAL